MNWTEPHSTTLQNVSISCAACESPDGTTNAAVAQPVVPVDRLGPLRLGGRSGRTVVRAGVALAPPALEVDPRQRVGRVVHAVGQQHDLGLDTGRRLVGVVAAEPFGPAATHVERGAVVAGVRSLRRVHDRVRALALAACRRPSRRARRPRAGRSRRSSVRSPAPRRRSTHRTAPGRTPSRPRACCSSRCSTSTASTGRRAGRARRAAGRCGRRRRPAGRR